MDNVNNNEEEKIIDINRPEPDTEEEAVADTFAEIQRKNMEKQERLRKERAAHNKKVTRNFRLKK
jgi:hypothetical protein